MNKYTSFLFSFLNLNLRWIIIHLFNFHFQFQILLELKNHSSFYFSIPNMNLRCMIIHISFSRFQFQSIINRIENIIASIIPKYLYLFSLYFFISLKTSLIDKHIIKPETNNEINDNVCIFM